MDINDIALPEDIQAIKDEWENETIISASYPTIQEDILKLVEAFENEYRDVIMLDHNVSKVYDHITWGRISKPNTKAEAVIAVVNDIVTDLVNDSIEEATVDLKARIAELEKHEQEREYD